MRVHQTRMSAGTRLWLPFVCLIATTVLWSCKADSPVQPSGPASLDVEEYGAPSNRSFTALASNAAGDVFAAEGTALWKYSKSTHTIVPLAFSNNVVWDVCFTKTGTMLAVVYDSAYSVQRSTDNGASWTRAMTGIDGEINDMRCYPSPAGEIFLRVKGKTASLMSVYVSNDDAKTWTLSIKTGTDNLTAPLDVGFLKDGSAILSSLFALYKTTNHGASWSNISSLTGFRLVCVSSKDRMFLIDITGYSGKYSDDGVTYQTFYPPGKVFYMTAASDGSILCAAHNDTGRIGNIVKRSSDNGVTWKDYAHFGEEVDYITFSGTQPFFATKGFGIVTTTDNGANWEGVGPRRFTVDGLAVDATGNVIVQSAQRVVFTTNSGQTWIERGSLWPNAYYSVGVDRTSGTLLVGGKNFVYQSTNMGTKWDSASARGGALRGIGMLPNGKMFAGGESDLYFSTDRGVSWFFSRLNPPPAFHSLAVSGNSLVLGSVINGAAALSTSTDGNSLTSIGGALPVGAFPKAIAVNSKGHIFLSMGADVLYKSTDNGGSWSAFKPSALAAGDNIEALAFSASDTLYIGTDNTILRTKTPL